MIRSFLLLTAMLLFGSCRTKPKSPSEAVDPIAPENTTPTSTVGTETLESCIRAGKSFEPDKKICQDASVKTCFEKNQIKSYNGCFSPSPSTELGLTDLVDFSTLCQKNEAGAFINCKDGELDVKVAALPTGPNVPSWVAEAPIAVELIITTYILALGTLEISVSSSSGETKPLLLNQRDKSLIFREHDSKAPLRINFKFSADTIILSSSSVKLFTQITIVSDLKRISTEAAAKQISATWVSNEAHRLKPKRWPAPELYNDWINMIKTIPGAIAFDLRRDCPADKIREQFSTFICSVEANSVSKAEWKGKPFINLCIGSRAMTIEAGQSRFGLLSSGVFPNEDFTIKTPDRGTFFGDCFIYVYELNP